MERKIYKIPLDYLPELQRFASHDDGRPDAEGKTSQDRYEELWVKMGKELGFNPATRKVISPN